MVDEKKLDEKDDVELNEETIEDLDLDADNAEGVVGGASSNNPIEETR